MVVTIAFIERAPSQISNTGWSRRQHLLKVIRRSRNGLSTTPSMIGYNLGYGVIGDLLQIREGLYDGRAHNSRVRKGCEPDEWNAASKNSATFLATAKAARVLPAPPSYREADEPEIGIEQQFCRLVHFPFAYATREVRGMGRSKRLGDSFSTAAAFSSCDSAGSPALREEVGCFDWVDRAGEEISSARDRLDDLLFGVA